MLDCLFLTENNLIYTQRNIKHEDSSYARFPFRDFPLIENHRIYDCLTFIHHLHEGVTYLLS
jgi:hypothetical protein